MPFNAVPQQPRRGAGDGSTPVALRPAPTPPPGAPAGRAVPPFAGASDTLKVRALEALAAGEPLGCQQRVALRAVGIEPRELRESMPEREWTDGARTLLLRLLARGWSPVAIAVFCRRSPGSVVREVRRCGWPVPVQDAVVRPAGGGAAPTSRASGPG